ncbi:MAG: hypothetical protein K1X78_08020 [Verrucomicrobiaceae bacterium]|nr:hypothetical protein [Verrucomicrobiaceae bacterium]
MTSRSFFLVAATGLASCALPPAVETPAFPAVTPASCLSMAEAYRTHRWTGTVANAKHGLDSHGIRVDTPDISYQKPGAVPGWWHVGAVNESVPYQWGGFSTIAEFDAGLRAGKAAGDVYTSEKRRLLDDAVSSEAVGIDCSGFISRCWKLPRSFSTRELAALCVPLNSWDDLHPGDILNTFNAHCLLFAGWNDPAHEKLIAYETGSPPDWKVVVHTIDANWLRSLGYRPFRYRNMEGAVR